ncbi:(p)ppGpp synthetase [Yersinia ruckeri]|uniref:GTP pyrophosphokinase n=1 Tax=Yersinia TaxID=629 RepID=UPI0005DAD10D|nr:MULTISPECIES: (p)ppGpp synthetase [Yersinia]MCW6593274.1 (p)ppGpp synthetase [Yersinia ruckeri]UIN16731.1 (p)ppGpp synthetase [Yersinia ruckeri]CNF20861.1 GTP pyrophosphokinase yjbM [Yersinia mollaretii]
MNEIDEFIATFEREKDIYSSWGKLVLQNIQNKLKENEMESILKIEPSYRMKDISSLIEKAFYRSKNYKNPYEDITDKVGVRFVVLLTDDIPIIKKIIEDCSLWEYSDDRDFIKEKEDKPYLFDYQSVHYVVKNLEPISIGENILIPTGTPCEIQVRTLLQHAYAEVSHDSVYKCKAKPSSDIKRRMARTIALMESTDELFLLAKDELSKSNVKIEKWANHSISMYYHINVSYNKKAKDKILYHILNIYFETLTDQLFKKYLTYLDDNNGYKEYFAEKINSDCITGSYIKQSAAIVFCLFMVDKKTQIFKNKWPFSENDLNEIMLIMGN